MLLAAMILGGLVGLALAAAVLSSACSLVRVQPPDFFFAMVICFFVGMILLTVQFMAGVAGTLGAGVPLSSLRSLPDFQRLMTRGAPLGLLSTPFLSAGVYTVALRDCSYGRALLVWVSQFVVIAVFLVALWALLSGLGLTARH